VRKTALVNRTYEVPDELALIQSERISTQWTNELRKNIRVYPTCNILKEGRVDFWILVEPRLQYPRRLCHVPVCRGSIQDVDLGKFLYHRFECLGPSLNRRKPERTGSHYHVAFAADSVYKRLRHRGSHEIVIRGQQRMHVDLIVRCDQRVD
jgi:hypothetical protein